MGVIRERGSMAVIRGLARDGRRARRHFDYRREDLTRSRVAERVA
jgi:hypothetical protein